MELATRIELAISVWKTEVSPQHFASMDLAYLIKMSDAGAMTQPDPNVKADAKERSLRSLAQGLALDVFVALVLVVATAFNDIQWTPTYWKILGLAAAKSILQAGASYLMRILVKPKE